ncbi:hypothetical protein BGW42_007686 [Actinomortierella wolfii]|nr:hypothetical protein BGW42_007686 [Actinomortierella wolfii]
MSSVQFQIARATFPLNGITYTVIDTPGLVELDTTDMQRNADEIVRALNEGGRFKILVVVRDEGGRADRRVAFFADKLRDSLPGDVKVAFVLNKVPVADIDSVDSEKLSSMSKMYNVFGDIFNPKYVMSITDAQLPSNDFRTRRAQDSFKLIRSDLAELLQMMDPITITARTVNDITVSAEEFNEWEAILDVTIDALGNFGWHLFNSAGLGIPQAVADAIRKMKEKRAASKAKREP